MPDTPSAAPEGYGSVNPWIIPKGAAPVIVFLERVFDAVEIPEARVPDADGLLIHAEVRIGDSVVMLFDSKPDWPATPSFLQVYVADADAVLQRAEEEGAEVVTRVTNFVYGERLGRFRDPWGNLWWINEKAADDADPDARDEPDGAASGTNIYDTLMDAMRSR